MAEITPLGKTDWRGEQIPFGIKDQDRLAHMYVLGKTGVGKSTLLLNMALSDIRRGNGLAVIDPHGDLAAALLQHIPQERVGDVLYFNPADTQAPVPFNPLLHLPKDQHYLAAAGLISSFKRIWSDSWGPRLEHILRFSLLTLLAYGDTTLLDITRLLISDAFRKNVLGSISDEALLQFWKGEFDRYSPSLRAEATASILNKVSLFQVNIPLRNTVGQLVQTWQVPEIMNHKKIFLANLSKGLLGEDTSSLLGSMLVNAFQLNALARVSTEERARLPFYLYIDEAHSFLSLAITDVLAEARKYGLSLFLANQYLGQWLEKVRAAIFGNVGTLMTFQVGTEDAEHLAKEFYPVFRQEDLIHLPRHHMYLKLMIDGASSKPFSAIAHPPPLSTHPIAEEVMASSQKQYGMVPSFAVEKEQHTAETNNGQQRLF